MNEEKFIFRFFKCNSLYFGFCLWSFNSFLWFDASQIRSSRRLHSVLFQLISNSKSNYHQKWLDVSIRQPNTKIVFVFISFLLTFRWKVSLHFIADRTTEFIFVFWKRKWKKSHFGSAHKAKANVMLYHMIIFIGHFENGYPFRCVDFGCVGLELIDLTFSFCFSFKWIKFLLPINWLINLRAR